MNSYVYRSWACLWHLRSVSNQRWKRHLSNDSRRRPYVANDLENSPGPGRDYSVKLHRVENDRNGLRYTGRMPFGITAAWVRFVPLIKVADFVACHGPHLGLLAELILDTFCSIVNK